MAIPNHFLSLEDIAHHIFILTFDGNYSVFFFDEKYFDDANDENDGENSHHDDQCEEYSFLSFIDNGFIPYY